MVSPFQIPREKKLIGPPREPGTPYPWQSVAYHIDKVDKAYSCHPEGGEKAGVLREWGGVSLGVDAAKGSFHFTLRGTFSFARVTI